MILTEDQLRALERSREEKQAHGEIETEHPGYLGAQDTYYVGTIKSSGRIYQQTFLDTYSKLAFAKLYDRNVAADLLNNRVLPFFEEPNVPRLRILTTAARSTVAIENLTSTSSTKARSPQSNGICERFHRTMQGEFYSVAFRNKLYTSLEEVQSDLDVWLREYNEQREHSGKYCYGKTPWRTFLDSKHLAQAKMLDSLTATAPSDVEMQSAKPERSPEKRRRSARSCRLKLIFVRSSFQLEYVTAQLYS